MDKSPGSGGLADNFLSLTLPLAFKLVSRWGGWKWHIVERRGCWNLVAAIVACGTMANKLEKLPNIAHCILCVWLLLFILSWFPTDCGVCLCPQQPEIEPTTYQFQDTILRGKLALKQRETRNKEGINHQKVTVEVFWGQLWQIIVSLLFKAFIPPESHNPKGFEVSLNIWPLPWGSSGSSPAKSFGESSSPSSTLSAKQVGSGDHFYSFWYDPAGNWTHNLQVLHWIPTHWTLKFNLIGFLQ